MKKANKHDVELILQPIHFTRSCLPITMKLAKSVYPKIERRLFKMTSKWPMGDRVLYWLLPELRGDIIKYHLGQGPSLKSMFSAYSIEKLDNQLAERLKTWVPTIRTKK